MLVIGRKGLGSAAQAALEETQLLQENHELREAIASEAVLRHRAQQTCQFASDRLVRLEQELDVEMRRRQFVEGKLLDRAGLDAAIDARLETLARQLLGRVRSLLDITDHGDLTHGLGWAQYPKPYSVLNWALIHALQCSPVAGAQQVYHALCLLGVAWPEIARFQAAVRDKEAVDLMVWARNKEDGVDEP